MNAVMDNLPAEGFPNIELGCMPGLDDVRCPKENWTGVSSTVLRRRLQNRLSQRAYRRRRKNEEASHKASTATLTPSERTAVVRYASSSPQSSQYAESAFNMRRTCETHARRLAAMRVFAQLAHASYMHGSPQGTHLPALIQYNVQSALMRNSEILGLSEMWDDYDAISPFYQAAPIKSLKAKEFRKPQDWPVTLHPTPLQVRMEHHPWIDVFPLPRMRDNVLHAIMDPSVCDEDELCYDIAQFGNVDKPCLIVWGQPWDPRSWEATIPFLQKWGWLLDGCQEIIEATNYWRRKRGERILTREELLDAVEMSRPKFIIF